MVDNYCKIDFIYIRRESIEYKQGLGRDFLTNHKPTFSEELIKIEMLIEEYNTGYIICI